MEGYTSTYFKSDLLLYYHKATSEIARANEIGFMKGILRDNKYTLFYVFSGRARVIYNGNRLVLTEGQLLLRDINTELKYEFDKNYDTEYVLAEVLPTLFNLTEDTDFLRPFCKECFENEPVIDTRKDITEFERIRQQVCSIRDCISAKFAREHHLAHINAIISELCLYYDRTYSYKTLSTDSVPSKLMDYINHHYLEKITFAGLRETFSVSDWTINTIVHRCSNMTLKQYVTYLRLNDAHKLLRFTSFSAKKIAEDCGFQSYPTFFNAYKKQFGTTPNQRNAISEKLWPLTNK